MVAHAYRDTVADGSDDAVREANLADHHLTTVSQYLSEAETWHRRACSLTIAAGREIRDLIEQLEVIDEGPGHSGDEVGLARGAGARNTPEQEAVLKRAKEARRRGGGLAALANSLYTRCADTAEEGSPPLVWNMTITAAAPHGTAAP